MVTIVLVSINSRNFHLKLDSGTLNDLRKEFIELCKSESSLSELLGTSKPSLCSKKPEFKGTPFEDKEFDILNDDIIENFSIINVRWSNKTGEQMDDSEIGGELEADLGNQGHQDNTSLATDSTDYYQSRDPSSIPFSQEKHGEHYTKEQWDSFSPTEQQNEAGRLQSNAVLKSMGINAPFVPVHEESGRSSQARGRSSARQTQLQLPQRRSARMAAQPVAITEQEYEPQTGSDTITETTPPQFEVPSFFQHQESEDEDDVLAVTENQGTSTSATQARPAGTAPKLTRRKFGSRYNAQNALPTFSNNLKQMLAGNSKIPAHYYLSEIKAHMSSFLKPGESLDRTDYEIVCKRVVEVYPILGNADDRSNWTDLKKSLRTSKSANEYYHKTGKFKRQAKRAARSQGQPQTGTRPTNQSSLENLMQELKTDSNASESRLRYLIRTTLVERKPQDVEPAQLDNWLLAWPHYQKGLLLIYEYSLQEQLALQQLYQNAAKFLLKLDGHKNTDSLQCIVSLQEDLMPAKYKNERVKPLIQVVEQVLADGDTRILDDCYAERSPHVIVTWDIDDNGEKVALAAVVKISQHCVSTCSNPTPATVLMLALAPYFLFHLDFPPAYESTLRLLEKYIHGSLSVFTSRKRTKLEYRDFLLKFDKTN